MSYALSGFGLFIDTTGPTIFRGPEDTVNDAQKTNYSTLGYMLRGQPMSEIIQGGSKIQDTWLGSVARRARSYKPNETQSYQITDSGTTFEVPWRFILADGSYTDEAMILNMGAAGQDRAQQYKSFWHRIQQDVHTDTMNYLAERFWAQPVHEDMEAGSGQELYSIPAFINEFGDGTYGQGAGLGFSGSNTIWTTKQGINPGSADDPDSKWACTQVGYGNAGGTGFTKDNIENIINRLDVAFRKTKFERPPLKQEYFTDAAPWPIGFVACSLDGITRVTNLYRESNDHWSNMDDPMGNPMYRNVPLVYEAELDDAAIYPTGGTTDQLGVESSTSNTSNSNTITDALGNTVGTGFAGPRFYGIQPKMLRMIWHKERFMTFLGEKSDVSQPTTKILPFNTYGNTVARSLMRHFIIFPGEDQ